MERKINPDWKPPKPVQPKPKKPDEPILPKPKPIPRRRPKRKDDNRDRLLSSDDSMSQQARSGRVHSRPLLLFFAASFPGDCGRET